MPRLTADQWAQIRAEREAGASFPELAARFGVSHQAIQKRAKTEGWGDGVGVVAACNPKKKAEAIDAAADRAAAVVERHKQDWDAHRARFGAVPEHFEDGKLAKITAEMLRIRHDGERRAWGLDEAAQAPTIEIVRSYGAGA
jgi:hypothetical protein